MSSGSWSTRFSSRIRASNPAFSMSLTKSDRLCWGMLVQPSTGRGFVQTRDRGPRSPGRRGARSGERGARDARLDVLPQMVQQHPPIGIALAVVAVGPRPSLVGEFDQGPVVTRPRQVKRDDGADGIARALDASPRDARRRDRLSNLPTESGPSGELEAPGVARRPVPF